MLQCGGQTDAGCCHPPVPLKKDRICYKQTNDLVDFEVKVKVKKLEMKIVIPGT